MKYVLEVPDSINARLEARAKEEHITARGLLVWLLKGDLFTELGKTEGRGESEPVAEVA